MNEPTITITIKNGQPQLQTNMPLEATYLVLSGTTNNVLLQLLSTKEGKRILTPNGNLASV